MSLRIAFVLSAALLASGCATVTRGTTEDVQFTSEPSGATVLTTTGHTCTTPCSFKIGRRDTFTATFTLGDQEKSVFVDTEVAGGGVAAGAGNVIIGGVVGLGVDVATGAGLNHTPNPVHAIFADPAAPTETETGTDTETPTASNKAPTTGDTPTS